MRSERGPPLPGTHGPEAGRCEVHGEGPVERPSSIFSELRWRVGRPGELRTRRARCRAYDSRGRVGTTLETETRQPLSMLRPVHALRARIVVRLQHGAVHGGRSSSHRAHGRRWRAERGHRRAAHAAAADRAHMAQALLRGGPRRPRSVHFRRGLRGVRAYGRTARRSRIERVTLASRRRA